jgi:hypothetical protein
VGQIKILEHKQNEKIRVLMRQNRTLKICANFVGKYACIIFADLDCLQIRFVVLSWIVLSVLGD